MTFPDNQQPDLPFAAVGSEGFVSPFTGRRIRGYLTIAASTAVPITAIGLNNGAVIEFEIGTPEADRALPIEVHFVGAEEVRDAIFKSAGRGRQSLPLVRSSASSSHRESIANE